MGNKRIAKKKQNAAALQEPLSARKIGALKAAGKEVPPQPELVEVIPKQEPVSPAKPPEKAKITNEKKPAEVQPVSLPTSSETKTNKASSKSKTKNKAAHPHQTPAERAAQKAAKAAASKRTETANAAEQMSEKQPETAIVSIPTAETTPISSTETAEKTGEAQQQTVPTQDAVADIEQQPAEPILTENSTAQTAEERTDETKAEPPKETASVPQTGTVLKPQPETETKEESTPIQPRVKRHYKLPLFAALTTVVALGSVLFVFLLFTISGSALLQNKADVDLPSFIGMSEKEVKANPEFANFNIEYVSAFAEDIKAGQIFSQAPKPPKQVKENAHITLRVSMGKHKVMVPGVIGLLREDAETKLRENELSVLIKVEENDIMPAETVLRTEPAAGTTLEAGSTISVYIARSKRETGTVVPSIVGLSKTKAEALLRSRGLAMGNASKVASDSPVGTILSQRPRPKTAALRGSSVSVSVSSGAPPAPPPPPAPAPAPIVPPGHVHQWVTIVTPATDTTPEIHKHGCPCGAYYED
ncbi:MAG: PASTA domain-containing protein [Ruthenibacterium sp.]